MKTLVAIFVMLVSCGPALCQQQLDAATKEDVQELFTINGSRQRVELLWAQMAQQAASNAADAYRLKHPNADPLELRKVAQETGEYMQSSMKVFSVDELLDAIIPVYQAHLTHADIRNIIDFYNTSSGQKLLKEMPAMMVESMQAVQPIMQKHMPEMVAAAAKAFDKEASSTAPKQ